MWKMGTRAFHCAALVVLLMGCVVLADECNDCVDAGCVFCSEDSYLLDGDFCFCADDAYTVGVDGCEDLSIASSELDSSLDCAFNTSGSEVVLGALIIIPLLIGIFCFWGIRTGFVNCGMCNQCSSGAPSYGFQGQMYATQQPQMQFQQPQMQMQQPQMQVQQPVMVVQHPVLIQKPDEIPMAEAV